MAVKQEDGSYIMNGSKVFITGGGRADTYVVFAMTDKTKGNKGISAFIVDKDDPASPSARSSTRWASVVPRPQS